MMDAADRWLARHAPKIEAERAKARVKLKAKKERRKARIAAGRRAASASSSSETRMDSPDDRDQPIGFRIFAARTKFQDPAVALRLSLKPHPTITGLTLADYVRFVFARASDPDILGNVARIVEDHS